MSRSKLLILIAIVVGLLIVGWALNSRNDKPAEPQYQNPTSVEENLPAEPSNPNVTGGSSGVGTGTDNDNPAETPSPAGGTDANSDRTEQ